METEEVCTIINLAADYEGCASKQIPPYETVILNGNLSDRLSEFLKFLKECQDIVVGLTRPTKKIPLIVQQLVKHPEQAYNLFKQIHPVN